MKIKRYLIGLIIMSLLLVNVNVHIALAKIEAIEVNQLFEGKMNAGQNQEKYILQVNSIGTLTFEFVAMDSEFDLLITRDGVTIHDTTIFIGNTMSYTFKVIPGEYEITISNVGSQEANFKIQTSIKDEIFIDELEPNNNYEQAQLLPLNQNFVGYLGNIDFVDYFIFDLETHSKVTITLESGISSILWRIEDDDNHIVEDNLVNREEEETGKGVVECYLHPGKYFIRLSNNTGGREEGNYQLQVDANPIEVNEIEPNNSSATAQRISLNSTIKGYFGYMGVFELDDYYKFTLSEPKNIRVELNSEDNVAMSIYNKLTGENVFYAGISYDYGLFEVDKEVFLEEGDYEILLIKATKAFHSYDNTKGLYEFTLSTPLFSDLGQGWWTSHVEEFVELGFVSGYLDGTFKPQNSITRAEFVKIVNKAFGLKDKFTPVNYLPFTDVDSQWKKDELKLALAARYITPATEFRHNAPINRQEAAKIIGYLLGDKLQTGLPLEFSDKNGIATWAKDYVAGLVQVGVLSKNEIFRPKDSITRAEAVKMLNIAREL